MKTNLANFMAAFVLVTALSGAAYASSHMDAPLITLDPAANTTDVYAFVDEDDGEKSLVVALGVYPHQEAGIGPNKYNTAFPRLMNSIPIPRTGLPNWTKITSLSRPAR